jgi:hypothetical protein
MALACEKLTSSAAFHPLRDAGILQQVFTFLPGNWLFLGAVCSEWRAVYAGLKDFEVCTARLDDESKSVACGATTTLYSAAVASPPTAVLAGSCGILINENLQLIAGLYADIETAVVLRELGMPLSDIVL